MQEVAYGRKIGAIKTLRFFTGCGLKAAKDAIEDKRVWNMDPELADHMRDYKSGTFAEDN
jgi:ribosomal protein L7/L12